MPKNWLQSTDCSVEVLQKELQMLNNTGQYYHLCLPHIGGRDMQPLAENQLATDFSHHSLIQFVSPENRVNVDIAEPEVIVRRILADDFSYIPCGL